MGTAEFNQGVASGAGGTPISATPSSARSGETLGDPTSYGEMLLTLVVDLQSSFPMRWPPKGPPHVLLSCRATIKPRCHSPHQSWRNSSTASSSAV